MTIDPYVLWIQYVQEAAHSFELITFILLTDHFDIIDHSGSLQCPVYFKSCGLDANDQKCPILFDKQTGNHLVKSVDLHTNQRPDLSPAWNCPKPRLCLLLHIEDSIVPPLCRSALYAWHLMIFPLNPKVSVFPVSTFISRSEARAAT